MKALENMKRLSSAQEIYVWLRQNEAHTLGLTTIYRALETLLTERLVQAVDLGDGEKRYEAVQPGHHHHHLICQNCRANIHLDNCFVDNLTDAIMARHGFQVTSHILEIFGTCSHCGREQT